ncbi:phage terminase large subunit GpA-like protein [Bradyrhizobium japonicum]
MWAATNRIYPQTAAIPGPRDPHLTPYVVGPERMIASGQFRRVVMVFGAQTGKSEAMLDVAGQRLDQRPGPILYVGPNRQFLTEQFEPRVMSLLEQAPTLTEKLARGKRMTKTRKMVACWPCPHCSEYFVPRFNLMRYPAKVSPMKAARETYLECPHCGGVIEDGHKAAMNERGQYVAPGQTIDRNGQVSGDPPDTMSVSYWVSGLASPFVSFGDRIRVYLEAIALGDDAMVQQAINAGFGELYSPGGGEVPEWAEIKEKARHADYRRGEVPRRRAAALNRGRRAKAVHPLRHSRLGFARHVMADRLGIPARRHSRGGRVEPARRVDLDADRWPADPSDVR